MKQVFFTEKETVNKMRRQPNEWEKILANATSVKGLTSKIYKELIQHNTKKTPTQLKNGQRT